MILKGDCISVMKVMKTLHDTLNSICIYPNRIFNQASCREINIT